MPVSTLLVAVDGDRSRSRSSPLYTPSTPDPADAVADRILVDAVMRRLDERGRSIIVLHYFLGMPISEVATSLGLPVGTVKSRLHRSLEEMRSEAQAALPVSAITEGGQLA